MLKHQQAVKRANCSYDFSIEIKFLPLVLILNSKCQPIYYCYQMNHFFQLWVLLIFKSELCLIQRELNLHSFYYSESDFYFEVEFDYQNLHYEMQSFFFLWPQLYAWGYFFSAPGSVNTLQVNGSQYRASTHLRALI